MINLVRIVSMLAAVASLTIGAVAAEAAEPHIFLIALCAVVCIAAGAVTGATFFMTETERR